MPKSNAVWGIDIGQCALKAIRCEPHEADPKLIVAGEFDYIEYPKILSQPEADPATLVREALQQFLSRNTVRGDHVAISVSGQSGLARFIKLPPVESSKIPDIVKYEARQQIPFSLDDVVWDYQQMAGGSEDEGFALETEVGLFAMKREQVYRALKPLDEMGIEVDFIQLAPLAIYNMICFDQLHDLPPADEYDPEDPPESLVILSVGTDNTDLVVTNGYRVWQRSVPLGGNHFTKALSKELRLTFAKAEHLKRNATEADDPKAVFQAMRPVFNDLLTEVQRSIGFFTGLDRSAKIGRVVALGNAMRLPGLQRFLSQNLGYDVTIIDSFRGLSGSSVVNAPAFKDNLLSFGVSYGLCLQGLGQANLRTNLLPKEIVTDRIIREKKPWAVAALAALLVGCTVNFLSHWMAWNSAHSDHYQSPYFDNANQVMAESARLTGEFAAAQAEWDAVNDVGKNLVSNVEGRLLWLEMLRALDAALPGYRVDEKKPEKIVDRQELHIDKLDCEHFADLSTWFSSVSQIYREGKQATITGKEKTDQTVEGEEGEEGADDEMGETELPPEPEPVPMATEPEGQSDSGPSGPGWVIELSGYHYYNEDRVNRGATFVRRSFLQRLEEGSVELPTGPGGTLERVSFRELGISHPVLIKASRIMQTEIQKPDYEMPDRPDRKQPGGPFGARRPREEGPPPEAMIPVKIFEFTIQFAWKPTPPSVRKPSREQAGPVVAARVTSSDAATSMPAMREE